MCGLPKTATIYIRTLLNPIISIQALLSRMQKAQKNTHRAHLQSQVRPRRPTDLTPPLSPATLQCRCNIHTFTHAQHTWMATCRWVEDWSVCKLLQMRLTLTEAIFDARCKDATASAIVSESVGVQGSGICVKEFMLKISCLCWAVGYGGGAGMAERRCGLWRRVP